MSDFIKAGEVDYVRKSSITAVRIERFGDDMRLKIWLGSTTITIRDKILIAELLKDLEING